MKWLKRFLLFSLLFYTVTILGYFTYILTSLNAFINHQVIEDFAQEIKDSPAADAELISLFNKINSQVIEEDSSVFNEVLSRFSNEYYECPCLDISYKLHLVSRKNTKGWQQRFFSNQYIFAHHLHQQVTQKQCLNYLLNNYDFLYHVKGVYEASQFYFKKELSGLTKKEKLGLLIMLRNPMLYNPYKRPAYYNRRLEHIMTKFAL